MGSGSVWRESNDHSPLWASYSISSGGLPQQGVKSMPEKKHCPLQTPSLMKPDDIKQFQERVSAFFDENDPGDEHSMSDAEKFIENICRVSPIIARRAKPVRKKNKFSFDGWSPILVVLRAQLICMHNIRRGLAGRKEKGVV